jgi:hypothetical protein
MVVSARRFRGRDVEAQVSRWLLERGAEAQRALLGWSELPAPEVLEGLPPGADGR